MDNKAITVSLAVLAVVTVAACGGGDAPTAGSSTQAAAPAGAIDPASVTDPGTISGMVNFGGTAPEGQPVQMAADPYCITSHAGAEVMAQRVVVNNNGTLRDVFVYVKAGLGDQTFIASGSSIELSQEGCMYMPHVLGVQANQAITIINNDDTLHNINGQPSGAGNNPFNFAQPIKGMSTEVTFPSAEFIPIKCDVHPWMQAYIGVTNHPYFAISSEDGSFTIDNLPAGNYTIAAWHESLGEQTQDVMVGANATAEISFDFGN